MANESKNIECTNQPTDLTDERKNEEHPQLKSVKLSSGYHFPRCGFGATWSRGVSAYWCGNQDEIWNNN